MKNNEPVYNLKYRKSNDLVLARYHTTLMENQIMSIALSRIEVHAEDTGDYTLEAKLYPGDLKRIIGDETHIYRNLKQLSKKITGRTMFLEDGKGNFKAFSVIPNAEYEDGVFKITFNNELRRHVFNLGKGNQYTSYELAVITNFKKNTTFRLYEVLKKDTYRIPQTEDDACIQVEYNLNELRFIIGLANSEAAEVKKAILDQGNNVDWDDIFERLEKKDKTYEDWRDFRKYILEPAKAEMEEKSDIRFEFEGIREKRKVRRVLFRIYHNMPNDPILISNKQVLIDKKMTINRQLEMAFDLFPELYEDYTGHNGLTVEDINLLFTKAGGDEKKIRDAIELADQQPNISNYMGWIIAAIERNYNATPVMDGSEETAKKVKGVKEHLETNRSRIADQVWQKIKTKEDFSEFAEELKEKGFAPEDLELIYSSEELTKAYTNWKVTKEINLE